jgi:hypothetical protein
MKNLSFLSSFNWDETWAKTSTHKAFLNVVFPYKLSKEAMNKFLFCLFNFASSSFFEAQHIFAQRFSC